MTGDTAKTSLEALKEARQSLRIAALEVGLHELTLNGPRSVQHLAKAEERMDKAAAVLAEASRAYTEERQALGRTA